MIHLLDANVLIALVDAAHPHRAAALCFFQQEATSTGWATCPLTENAFLRILGGAAYRDRVGSPEKARILLGRITSAPGHHFWPDDVSLVDLRLFPSLPGSRHLTDCYLLALAVKHGGSLATFDAGIDPELVPGGTQALHLIPST